MLVSNTGTSPASRPSAGVLSTISTVLSAVGSSSDCISSTGSTSLSSTPSIQSASLTTSSVIRSSLVEPQDSDIMSDVLSTLDITLLNVTNSSVPDSTTPFKTSTRISHSSLFSSTKTSPNEATFLLPQTLSGGSLEQPSNSPKPPTPVAVTRTTTEISVKPPKTSLPTSTRTITDQPESTLSIPVAISVFNPDVGKTSLNTPAFVTVFSPSTEPDGGFVTYTHEFADPSVTATSDSQTVVQTGFLGNRGAVAGVFTVVGILACSIIFFLALLCRRRHRKNRRKRWLASIQSHCNNSQMRGIGEVSGHQGSTTPLTSRESIGHNFFNSINGPALPASVPNLRRSPVPIIDSFQDTSSATGLVGSGIGYGHTHHLERKPDAVSTTQSSPSIYPSSLPPFGDDDNTTDATNSPISDDSSDASYSKSIASGAPPRPPRSPLRRSVTKSVEMYPMAPSPSVSSDTPASSPIILDAGKVINRRTLLSVRPQASAKYTT